MLDCDNPFWKFSLAVYAAPGVAAECLALQRALNINVNSLLFCAWLGSAKKIILTETNMAAIGVRARHWHETVVQSLRAVRQHLKTMPETGHDVVKDLRKDIAATELRAEQIEQALLFDATRELVHGVVTAATEDAVRRNVTALLQRKRLGPVPAVVDLPSAKLLIEASIAYRS